MAAGLGQLVAGTGATRSGLATSPLKSSWIWLPHRQLKSTGCLRRRRPLRPKNWLLSLPRVQWSRLQAEPESAPSPEGADRWPQSLRLLPLEHLLLQGEDKTSLSEDSSNSGLTTPETGSADPQDRQEGQLNRRNLATVNRPSTGSQDLQRQPDPQRQLAQVILALLLILLLR